MLTSSFTNCTHPVLFPIPHAPGVPAQAGVNNAPVGALTWAPNGVAASMIFDVDGSVSAASAGSYLANDTPLLRPAGLPPPTPLSFGYYANPLIVPGPGTSVDNAYGQILLEMVSDSSTTAIPYVTVTAFTRGLQQDVYDALRSDINWTVRRFPCNVLLTPPGGTTERYDITYPPGATAPPAFSLRLQFSVAGRSALFSIPYPNPAGPSSVSARHVLFPTFPITMTAVSSVAAVENGTGFEYYHDAAAGLLWLRPTLQNLSAFGLGVTPMHPLVSGREMTIEVQ